MISKRSHETYQQDFLLESMAKGSIFYYGTFMDFKHTTSKTSQLARREHKKVEML